MQCIFPQGQTTPERILSNPWYDKGFCEPGQYKAAIDRCKGGYDSCELFISVFSERAKIEQDYVDELNKWCSSSIKDISQTKEFGTNKKMWIEAIRASTQIANTHSDMVQRIQENVVNKMVTYKKENYGKSVVHVKKIKEFERDFEQVQKSWTKLLDKISKAKKEYQDAHRQWKKAETAERIIESDNGAEDEQKQKVKTSVGIYKKECDAVKSKYHQAIKDMENNRPNYEKAMKQVLDRTNEFEKKRFKQWNELVMSLHESLIIKDDAHLKKMSADFTKALNEHSIEKDIQWWNTHFGSDTNTNWPTFEELKD